MIDRAPSSGGPVPFECASGAVRTEDVVQIIALVKPFRARAVLEALRPLAPLSVTAREAMGHGRQKNRLSRYRGSEYNTAFVPKVELCLFIKAPLAPEAIKIILGQARTGRIGDGKILVLPCAGAVLTWS